MTLTYMVQLELISCYKCGVEFGMTASMNRQRLDDRETFYCPNGHGQHYSGKTEAQKERERAAQLERRLACRDEDLRAERAAHATTRHRLTATKGVLTKTKKRVANGVCPCCNRHFANVERHITNQHPDYIEQVTA